MPVLLPDIPEAERTPLVRQLLEIIRLQQERIQQLEDVRSAGAGPPTRRRDRPPQGPQGPTPDRPQHAGDADPATPRPQAETARLRQALQDRPIDHHRGDRHPLARHPGRGRLQGLRGLRRSGSDPQAPRHPLPPRTLADPRRPKPGGPPARRGPARQPLRSPT